jgi:predicted nucleotidyltransferase
MRAGGWSLGAEEELRRYVKGASRLARLHAAILFGSHARGDYGPWSDYDLLLIGDFKGGYLERLEALLNLEAKVPVEPHPYTLEEAVKMIETGHPTLIDAMEEGIVLMEDEEYLDKVLRRYRELKAAGKLVRTSTSIIF